MGTVYEAVQLALGRRIAIKVLSDLSPRGAERFAHEALATAALQHPCVVQVSDFRAATDEEPAFLVMELLEGKSLAQLLRAEGQLDPGRAIAITNQILSALAAAHRVDVVHRDVKPANVFVVDHPGGALVKVLDFGIAKLIGEGQGVVETASTVFGSVPYMAPEQLLGGSVDARVDIYATTVCLFEMLTGRRPFDNTTTRLVEQIADLAPDIRTVRPDLPAALALVVARGLAKQATDRFATADAMRDALITVSRDVDSSAAFGDAFARSLAWSPADGSRPSDVPAPLSRDLPGSRPFSEADSRTDGDPVGRSVNRSKAEAVVVVPARSRTPLLAGVIGVLLVTLGVAVGLTGASARSSKPAASSTAEVRSGVTAAPSDPSAQLPDAAPVNTPPPASAPTVGSASAVPIAKQPTVPKRAVGPVGPADGVRLDHRK